jgi:hypothetical protein
MIAGLLLSGAIGTLMVAYAARNLWREHVQSTPKVRESRKVEEKSHNHEKEVIKLRDIAHIWREIETGKPEESRPRPVFSHREIDDFYAKHVDNPVVKGNRRIVIEKLLEMLDTGGDCPSIVGRGRYENDREPERGYAIERYDCFARIPLWQHSITVAEKYISKFQYKVMVPNALVIALGHDIGIIEAEYAKYYTKLTHPEISLLVLKSITEFTSLENFEEISSIIMSHHSITNLKLAKILKASDQEARNIEFNGPETARAFENAGEIQKKGKGDIAQEKEETVLPDSGEVESFAEKVDPRKMHDGGEPTNQSKNAPKEIVPLPHWLDFGAILSHVGKEINILEKTADLSLNWSAYSVRGGYVWVKEELLWEAVMKTSGENAGLFAAEEDKALKWDILYTVVMELGRRGMAAREMIREGYYQAPVTVLAGKRTPSPAFMTPFLPGAFDISPDELEKRKGSLLASTVRDIVPKRKDNPP